MNGNPFSSKELDSERVEAKEGDYELPEEYDTEGMFDEYMGVDGKQDDEGLLHNASEL